MVGSKENYWEAAVQDMARFNSLYAQVEHQPLNEKILRKCVRGIDRLLPFSLWASKCLSRPVYNSLLETRKAIFRLPKDATVEGLRASIENYKFAAQKALDSTAPASFSYQGFPISNAQRFGDELCRKALQGLDYLRVLFKKRGVSTLLATGISRVVLEHEIDAVAYFHSGTRELVLSVPELLKGRPSRIIDDFTNETFLHEFGHYVHRIFITGEARAAWEEPWGDLPSLANRSVPQVPEGVRKQKLDPLEIVTEYGKTDKYEDFAETFVVFMAAPEKLTPTAKFRMQRALSLSGLYGKPVMRLASADRVVKRWLKRSV